MKHDVDVIKQNPDRVLMAGDAEGPFAHPEHEAELDRKANGIPYHPEVIEWFKHITAELGIEDRL